MQPASLRSALLLLSLSLAHSGCGRPGLERFSSLEARLEDYPQDGQLPPQVALLVFFSRPEGDKHDCALASADIVATVNGHPMYPVEGVQQPFFSVTDAFRGPANANCFAPAFRVVLSREEALAEGGRATVVVQEGEERVSLVSDQFFNPHGPAGAGPWKLQANQGTLIPWSPADDDLSRLRSSIFSDGIRMEPRQGALWVVGSRGEYVNRRLSLEGNIGVNVSACEGIEACTATVPVHQWLDLQIY